MVGETMNAGFVPVDAVFSGDGAGYMHMSAGERLREARAKSGLTLDNAAAQTRIRRDYLEALEGMDARGLPARAYAIGYLRTYAGFLGLDSTAIVEQFKRDVDTETGRAEPSAAAPTIKEIKLPRGVFGAVLILASVGAIAWWYSDLSTGGPAFDTLPAAPNTAPEWAQAGFTARSAEISVQNIWADLPLGTASTTAATSLVMRAVQPTWLEVRDRSGRILFSRELVAGEVYRANESGLTVSAANAGAIELEVDGEARGPLGETGAPVENFAVLAAAIEDVPAE
jgi:cytoskeleton protein RodZ